MSLKIGNTVLKHGLILAPMAGVSDFAYRSVCRAHGAEYSVSEMVSAKALHFGDKGSIELARIVPEEQPMAVQIFGSDPDIMAEAAAFLSGTEPKPAAIDINFGCPAKKIVSNREGGALMREPALAGRIMKAAALASSVPVTAKMRTGWDNESKNAVEFAKILEENGAAVICVHGRTREQMYAPPVDIETIAAVKKAVSVPVIANGGIYTAADALKMLELTGCDGLMLARGTMGNPWLFEEITAALENMSYKSPGLNERLNTAIGHMNLLIENKGEKTGVLEARRQLSYYITGVDGAAAVRGKLNCACTLDEMTEIISELL